MATSTRKFVMKHVFRENLHESDANAEALSTKWQSFAFGDRNGGITVFFHFEISEAVKDQAMQIKVTNRLTNKNGEIIEYGSVNGTFNAGPHYHFDCIPNGSELEWNAANLKNALEHHIEVKAVFPLVEQERQLKKDFGSAEPGLTDVALILDNRKFHVAKPTLAALSSYFYALFLGTFVERDMEEIELKDADPDTMQLLLEIIYHAPDINDENVEKILNLARMYDVKIAIAQCEKHLLGKNYLPLEEKSRLAKEYKMVELDLECSKELAKEEALAPRIRRV